MVAICRLSLLLIAVAVLAAPVSVAARSTGESVAFGPAAPPQLTAEDLTVEIEVVPEKASVPLGGTYRATVIIENTSAVPVTMWAYVMAIGKHAITWCEVTTRLDPAASVEMECEIRIADALMCDTRKSVEADLIADDGTRALRSEGFVIDVEDVPTDCPKDPNPAIRVSAYQDGPPLSVASPSTAGAHVRNIGDVMLELIEVYVEPVDQSLRAAIVGWCYTVPDHHPVLRPDETANLPCHLELHEPIPCDVSMQPAYAYALWDEWDGMEQFARASGAAFVVDLEGVGPCSDGEGGSSVGAGGPPVLTPPPTDSAVAAISADRGPSLLGALGLLLLVTGAAAVLRRHRSTSSRRWRIGGATRRS